MGRWQHEWLPVPGLPWHRPRGEAVTTALMRELEHEARARSNSLEATAKLPDGFTAKHYPLTRSEQTELRRLKAALLLAEDADTFVALVKKRPLPRTESWFRHRIADLQHRR